ncbi:MAG: BatD family protein [Bergeyella zoohelcum]|nr:BatD family protein [Bergeyella zoohelcum]
MSNKLQFLLMMFCSIIFYGQVSIAVDVGKRTLNGREQFVLTVIQEVNGLDFVQETPLRSPDLSKFNIIGQNSFRQTFADPNTKTLINQNIYEFLLEPKQSGKIKIGSFLVTVSGTIYKSEPFDILVRDNEMVSRASTNNFSDDISLTMEVADREVYQNQPVTLVVRAFSRDFNDLRRIGKLKFSESKSLKISPISFQKSEIEQKAKTQMASQVIAVMTAYPNDTGEITIPAVSVGYGEGQKVKSNALKIKVKELPNNPPQSFRNAVGDFSFSIENQGEIYEVGKPFEVVLKLKGEGNLDANLMPKLLEMEGVTIHKPTIFSDVKNTRNGTTGEIRVHYLVVPNKAGKINIKTEDFSFFNPKNKEYIDLGDKSLSIEVLTAQQIADNKTALEKVNEYTNNVLETVDTPIVKTEKYKVEEREKLNWKLLLGNYALMFVFFMILLFVISKYKSQKKAKKNAKSSKWETIEETEKKILQEQRFDAETHLLYIERQIKQENYTAFFSGFEQMNTDFETHLKRKNLSLKPYLEERKGRDFYENYKAIVQKIKMEQYAPHHTEEHIQELYDEMKIIFSQIVEY